MASLRDILAKQDADKKAAQVAQTTQVAKPNGLSVPPEAPQLQKSAGRFAGFGKSPMPEMVKKPVVPPVEKIAEPFVAQVSVNIPQLQPQPIAEPSTTGPLGVEQLRTNLEYLANNIEHRELVGQVVRTIGQQLRQNPQFSSQLPMTNGDFDLLIRGLKASHKTMVRKRIETGNKKIVADKELDEIAGMVKDMGLNFKF